jgi:hypothetical protein
MAQISLGNFGNVTPGRVQQTQAPAGAFGAGTAQALENLGRVGSGIATDMQAADTRLQQQQMAEQLRAQAEERKRQEDQAEAVARAKESVALNDTEDKLRDLHDDVSGRVLGGQLQGDQAEGEFTTRAKELIDGALPNFRDLNRELVTPRLQSTANRLGNGVRHAVEKRGKAEVTASISTSLETFERLYRTEPGKAEALAAGTLQQMVPFSDLDPKEAGKLLQSWKERTQFTAGFEAVSAARNDRKALDAAEKVISSLPDLDPQKRAQLSDRAAAYRLRLDQQREMADARAARAVEARMRKAEAEFNTFQGLADKGTLLDPAYIDRAIAATAGTPYAAGIKALAQQAKDSGGLAAQSVPQQQAALDEVNATIAQRGRSPELDRRKDQIEKVLRGSLQDMEKDPLRAGLERGVITDLRPLDMAGGIQGVVQQLRERIPAAERVSSWAGRPVSPFTDDESATLKRQLDALPAKERSAAVAALAGAVGPAASQGLAAQIDKKDKPLALAFAFAGAQTTNGRYTSELLLKGAQAKADGTSTKGEKQPEIKVAGWSARIAAQLDGVFPAQTLTDQTREAALLITHGIAAESGGELREKDIDRAVGLALGGTLVEHNGRRVPLPAGLDADGLEKRLQAITPEELAKQAPGGMVNAGGAAVPLADFAKSLPGQELGYAGPGRFQVIVNGRAVLNGAGKPIIIKVN